MTPVIVCEPGRAARVERVHPETAAEMGVRSGEIIGPKLWLVALTEERRRAKA